MRYWLVMPAAGAGRRFGGAKQFAALHERTVLELALQPFIDDPQCVGGSIALSAGEPRREELARRLPARFETTEGGGTRAHSVLNALAALAARAAESDWVLVHDAARALSRDSLWLAQTPQTFRLGALRAALEQALSSGRMPTDEAQAMEWQGVSARLIEARDTNIKVTGAADLLLAQAILQARAAGKDLPA